MGELCVVLRKILTELASTLAALIIITFFCRRAAPKEQEPRVPFSKRKLSYKSTFLPVSVAFHHMAMAPVVELVANDCERLGARRRQPLPLLDCSDLQHTHLSFTLPSQV
jgi:hypothetical protein